jgi:hypothetical protein
MRGRVLTALAGAVIGSGLALLDLAYSVPQTTAGWFAFYVLQCIPWALLGAVVSFMISRRGKPNH